MNTCVCLVLLLFAVQSALAAVWDGQLFNYQLGELFNAQTNPLPGVQVYFIDLFDNDVATITAMRNAGYVPVCYFSTQYENWRPDASKFTSGVIGSALGGWPGENWVDIRSQTVRDIMRDRIALCKQKGFLAIDADNTDGYTQPTGTGFPVTAADTLNFLSFLSAEARAQGLGVGLKNTLDLITPANVPLWDFAVNEQCYYYKECGAYAPFQAVNKTVFHIEYLDSTTTFQSTVCPYTAQYGLTSIRKPKNQSLNRNPWQACSAVASSPSPPPSPSPSPSPFPTTAGCGQALAIPSYFYPGALWTQAKQARAKIMVINPNSGPDAPDAYTQQAYVNTVLDMKAAGVTVLGYVPTDYARKSQAVVMNDIAKYFGIYGVQGIFLDEGSNLCTNVTYYDQLVQYAKATSPTAVMALNWGTDGPECFLNSPYAVDIVVNFEGKYSQYLQWTGPAPWVRNYKASRFWQLVHTTPTTPEAFWKALTLSKSRNAGFIYITDDAYETNPWDSLPQDGLWSLEVGMVQSTQQIGIQGPYVYPCTTATCAWTRAIGTARIALANPNSGPGTAVDPSWTTQIAGIRSSGMLMLGYIMSTSSNVPKTEANAKAEIARYFTFYPNISGIFLDAASSSCTYVNYYASLIAYTRGFDPDAVVALNWGAGGSECYLNSTTAPDLVGVFEDTAANYAKWTPPAWHAKYPAYKFWHMVRSASTDTTTFANTVNSTATKRAGYVYVTTLSGFTNLPSAALWSSERTLVSNATVC